MKRLALLMSLVGVVFAKETELEEVVISATRQELKLKQVPSPAKVVNRGELDALGRFGVLRDLSLTDSSLYSYKNLNRGRSFFSIRGFDADKVLVLIDGRRIASTTDRDFDLDRLFFGNFERVEVLKGPASVLYGSDAIGGVVNVITREPQNPEFRIRFKAGKYTSSNEPEVKEVTVGAYTGRLGRFNVGVFAGYKDQEMYINKSTRESVDTSQLISEVGVNLFFYLDEKGQSKLRFDAGFQQNKPEQIFTSTVPRVGTSVLAKTKNEDKRTNLSLSFTHSGDNLRVFLRGYSSELETDLKQYEIPSGRFLRFDDQKFYLRVLEGNLSFDAFTTHRITVGGEYRKEGVDTTRLGRGRLLSVIDRGALEGRKNLYRVEGDFYGVYLQDEWFVSDKLFLVLGVRYDDSSEGEADISPRAGLTYNISETLRLKASYSQGFRNPPFRERFIFFRFSNYFVNGNENLKSEKTQGFDIALEKDFDKVSLRVGGFYLKAKDLIELAIVCDNTRGRAPAACPILDTPLPPGFLGATYRNIGEASISGAEFSFDSRLSKNLGLRLSYTFLEAYDEKANQRLTQRPRHRLVSQLNWKPFSKTSVSFSSEHTSDILLTQGGPKKSFNLLNLYASQGIGKNFELFSGVDNITNQRDADLGLTGTFLFLGMKASF
ncbi:MAG: TonB-dependent receptor [Aquificaceae bacterium]|nr:TonB-dependent receptor [Aquificaceae bacterium]MDW8237479.1 TonB-dependent receptor [Aquificaceae bacterium]